MPAVPGTHTVTPTVAATSEMNSFFRDPINFLLLRPHAELRQTSSQTIATSTNTPVQFNAEDVDTDVDGVGAHDNVTNNSRYTARYPGWYLVSGVVEFAANATGLRFAWLAVNGTDVNASVGRGIADAASNGVAPSRPKLVYLNVGDYVELIAFQSSGGNLATVVSTRDQSSMSVLWVSN